MNYIFNNGILDGLKDAFLEYGFVRVTNVFSSQELEEILHEIERIQRIAEELPDGLVWFSPSIDAGQIIQRISRINQHSEAINNLGHFSETLKTISCLALRSNNIEFADGHEGSDGSVLVIKDPLNVSVHKELRWHQDSKFTQHLPINPFINLGVYLDDSDVNRGGLVVLPCSHRLDIFDKEIEETTRNHKGEICVPVKAGDICLHSSDLWHCSRASMIPSGLRRILYFNYYAK